MKKSFQLAVIALATAFVLHSCGGKETTPATTETTVVKKLRLQPQKLLQTNYTLKVMTKCNITRQN